MSAIRSLVQNAIKKQDATFICKAFTSYGQFANYTLENGLAVSSAVRRPVLAGMLAKQDVQSEFPSQPREWSRWSPVMEREDTRREGGFSVHKQKSRA